jgi:hypothetical protein
MRPTSRIWERENLHAKIRSRRAICTLDGADSRWIQIAAEARTGTDVQRVDGGPHRVAIGNSLQTVSHKRTVLTYIVAHCTHWMARKSISGILSVCK